jgi:hypothetical protein
MLADMQLKWNVVGGLKTVAITENYCLIYNSNCPTYSDDVQCRKE